MTDPNDGTAGFGAPSTTGPGGAVILHVATPGARPPPAPGVAIADTRNVLRAAAPGHR